MIDRVLVLGASGFIGRRIVDRLARRDSTIVIAASRRPASASLPGNAMGLALDARDSAALAKAMKGVTAVISCVAGSAETIVATARTVFQTVAAAVRPVRVIHFSSLAVYGSIEASVDEDAAPRGDLGEYSAAKLQAERLGATCPSAVILRPGIVYGPESPWWSDRIARLLTAHRLGDLGSAGAGLCNLVFVDDVANAACLAIWRANIEGRRYNLGSPKVPTWNEYFAKYAAALGAAPVRRISAARLKVESILISPAIKLMETASSAGLIAAKYTPTPIRPWLLTLCRQRIAMQVSRAQDELGLSWTPLEEGLKTSADWFVAGGRT